MTDLRPLLNQAKIVEYSDCITIEIDASWVVVDGRFLLQYDRLVLYVKNAAKC